MVAVADINHMSMVARYKKNGGFVQLLQVMETCGPKKYEQFISIIAAEDPDWAEAIKEKMLTFDKILCWSPETLMEVLAQVNPLAFGAALKGLTEDKLNVFLDKLSPQDKRKMELQLSDANPTAVEISSAVMKVVSETRALLSTSVLKSDKIDPKLTIPENFEDKLSNGFSSTKSNDVDTSSVSDAISTLSNPGNPNASSIAAFEIDKLQKKLTLVNRELQTLKQENILMKDKLDKIKRIA